MVAETDELPGETDDWYVYVVECDDDSLYTGIAKDVERRVREHNESSAGAKYTRARRPVELRAAWRCRDRSAAASQEAAFKSLRRNRKLRRIEVGTTLGELHEAVSEYRRVFAAGDSDRDDFRPIPLAGDPDTIDVASRMAQHATEAYRKLGDFAPSLAPPESAPLFFVGPGWFDGHAIEIDGSLRVFFDLRLLLDHFDDPEFAADVHALHEYTHALHYANCPRFYPGRAKSPADEIWHRIVAEGLAIRYTEHVLDASFPESTWFGLIDSETVDRWRRRADERRPAIREALRELEASVRFDGALWNELFRSLDRRETSRLGYWYGREIVERAEHRADDLAGLLKRAPSEWRADVEAYFAEGD